MNLITDQKEEVRKFWNTDPCGARYLEGREDFEAHARTRYELEPYIADFARFQSARGLQVLEEAARRSEELVRRSDALYEAGRAPRGDTYAARVTLGNDRIAAEQHWRVQPDKAID